MRVATVAALLVVAAACGDGVPTLDGQRAALAVGPAQACPAADGFVDHPPRGPLMVNPALPLRRFPGLATATVCPGGATACARHTVFLPPAGVPMREPLLVYLPGTDNRPENQQFVQQMAAYAGYRTIGLSYDNRLHVGETCGRPEQQYRHDLRLCAEDCPGRVRREKLLGEDASPELEVEKGDSILVRLYTLLVALHQAAPDQGWDAYFEPPGDGERAIVLSDIRWDQVIVAGFSQGGGNAAYISKVAAEVHGAFLIDAEVDYCADPDQPPFYALASWLTDAVDLSAARPRFAIHHRGWDLNEEMWPHLAIVSTGDDAARDVAPPGEPLTLFADPPLDGAWTVQQGARGCGLHLAMASDSCMPTDPVQRDPAPTADQAWLYRAYLERLCYACDAATCPLLIE